MKVKITLIGMNEWNTSTNILTSIWLINARVVTSKISQRGGNIDLLTRIWPTWTKVSQEWNLADELILIMTNFFQ